jgi:hypothetical protein
MYSRNWNKGFGKRRTILQLDGDNPDSSTTKNLPRTGMTSHFFPIITERSHVCWAGQLELPHHIDFIFTEVFV